MNRSSEYFIHFSFTRNFAKQFCTHCWQNFDIEARFNESVRVCVLNIQGMSPVCSAKGHGLVLVLDLDLLLAPAIACLAPKHPTASKFAYVCVSARMWLPLCVYASWYSFCVEIYAIA